jgi:hypothetical protein
MSLKNTVTPPGIDPGTVKLVSQHLNHYATPGPGKVSMPEDNVSQHSPHKMLVLRKQLLQIMPGSFKIFKNFLLYFVDDDGPPSQERKLEGNYLYAAWNCVFNAVTSIAVLSLYRVIQHRYTN